MTHKPNRFDEELGRLADGARRSEATRARRQKADRSLLASLSATFSGTILELLETQSTTSVLTRSGSNLRGRVTTIGEDLVIIQSKGATRTVVRISAIEGLREDGDGHDRTTRSDSDGPTWAELLDELSHDNQRLAITLGSGNRVMGIVERVGEDQVVLRLDGGADALTIPLSSIDQAVIDR